MDQKEFTKLAFFNKFDLSEPESDQIRQRMEAILTELEPLAQAELGDAPIMVHAQGIAPVYRDDIVKKSISREEILAGAPEQTEHCFAVPRVAN